MDKDLEALALEAANSIARLRTAIEASNATQAKLAATSNRATQLRYQLAELESELERYRQNTEAHDDDHARG
jgi:hypothetical protein